MNTCANCSQPIEPDDGGAIWYHEDNMSAFCDGDDSTDLARQADPMPTRTTVLVGKIGPAFGGTTIQTGNVGSVYTARNTPDDLDECTQFLANLVADHLEDATDTYVSPWSITAGDLTA